MNTHLFADVAPPRFTGVDFVTLGLPGPLLLGLAALVASIVLYVLLRKRNLTRLRAALVAIGVFLAIDVATYAVTVVRTNQQRQAARERRAAEMDQHRADSPTARGLSTTR
jgi:hypothetical protein